jgi:hypothetical protein
MAKNISVTVESFDELRDSLYQTGLFEMADCVVEISCGMDSSVNEVEKMLRFIQGTINVVDSTVFPDNEVENYLVQLREVEPPYLRGPARRVRKN